MAAGEEKSDDFYAVLGLKKECTAAELRNAYKKLALRWHPDRCSASENSNYAEEAKKKFQVIQEAYSVLSDANKRFLYDFGIYDSDDDENGMGDFLNEMVDMMSQNKSNENEEESFEELQELFAEMFQSDIDEAFGSTSQTVTLPPCSYASSCESSNFPTKCDSSEMNSQNGRHFWFCIHFQWFCSECSTFKDAAEHQESPRGKGGGGGGVPGGPRDRRLFRRQKMKNGCTFAFSDYASISAPYGK